MKIKECGKDKKSLFKLTRNLICYYTNVKLPSYTSAKQLAGKFITFFMKKITAILDDLLCSSTADLCSIAMKADNIFSVEKLQEFHPASDSEIKEVIFNSPNRSYEFDPLPYWLL